MHVKSNDSELDQALVTTGCGQCITATSLKGIGCAIKGDIMWVTIHTASGRFESKAAFDAILFLTNLIVFAMHSPALYGIITHALTLLLTVFLHQYFTFLWRQEETG